MLVKENYGVVFDVSHSVIFFYRLNVDLIFFIFCSSYPDTPPESGSEAHSPPENIQPMGSEPSTHGKTTVN